jgi:hypothetical protein
MSALASMLAQLDAAVLAALTSKGVVARAQRDVEQGKVAITARGLEEASAIVEGFAVTIHAKGLKASRCTCPAVGLCRHRVTAVLALRAEDPFASAASPAIAPATRPMASPDADAPRAIAGLDFAGMDFAEIARFAGRDWPRALALATEPAEIARGPSLTVRFPESEDRVTFPAGAALAGALHKGRPARARLAIAAAALALARDAGRALPEIAAASDSVDPRTLDRAKAALEAAATLLAAGLQGEARERLFTVAIAARTEAAPRLAGLLRNLSRQLAPAAPGSEASGPGERLAALAEAYALTEALRRSPSDRRLLGTLARSFTPGDAMIAALVGAEPWRTPAGARGLTLVFADLATGRLHRATEARGAGVDLAFSAEAAWRRPLWGLATPADMLGRLVRLPAAALSADGALGLSQRAEWAPGRFHMDALAAAGVLQTRWSAVQALSAEQIGLRRAPGETLVLFAPQDVAEPVFDAYAQRWLWRWRDATGAAAGLVLPRDGAQDPATLAPHGPHLRAGLIAVEMRPRGVALRLMTLWLKGEEEKPFPLALPWPFALPPAPRGFAAVMAQARALVRPAPPPPPPIDPVRLFFDRALEGVASAIGGGQGGVQAVARLLADARALGLSRLAGPMEAFVAEPTAARGLRLGYLLQEARRLATPWRADD